MVAGASAHDDVTNERAAIAVRILLRVTHFSDHKLFKVRSLYSNDTESLKR